MQDLSVLFPDQTYRDLATGMIEKVQAFMERPGEMERFHAWKRCRSWIMATCFGTGSRWTATGGLYRRNTWSLDDAVRGVTHESIHF